MKILIVADPISNLKPQVDTTLAILRQSLKRKHQVYWGVATDIEYFGDHVTVNCAQVSHCEQAALPVLREKEHFKLKEFKVIFVRKDPPFDVSYVRLCWMLALVENETCILNSPGLLLRYHEKLLPLEALAHGFLSKKDIIPTHLGSGETASEFVLRSKFEKVISKPFLGFGGADVELMSRDVFLSRAPSSLDDKVVQPFDEEVVHGDHRVFFIEGKMVGSFARIPKEGGFISNLAAGGTAVAVKLNTSQRTVLEKLGKFLKKQRVFFAGADLIGKRISEVNITSPTGVISYQKLFGTDLSEALLQAAEKRVK